MRAYLTDAVKKRVKLTNSVLAMILGRLTKQLQPLDVGVNKSFKVKLRAAWEPWITDGEHTFSKTGRQRRATYATVCQWIANAWAKGSVSTVVQAFRKTGIITGRLGHDNDSVNKERDPGQRSHNCSTLTLKMKNLRDLWTRNEQKK